MSVAELDAAKTAGKPILWSPQQRDFLKWSETGTGSCVLEAVAGSGKTTTIIEAATRAQAELIEIAAAEEEKAAEEEEVDA